MKAQALRTTRRLHRRVGVVIALFTATIAITGVLLSFRGSLRAVDPVAEPVAEAPSIDALIVRAEAIGAAPVTDVTMPSSPTDPYRFWIDDDDETLIFLDGRGDLLGRRPTKGGVMQFLFAVHTGEVLGGAGVAISVFTGLSLLWLIVSGLLMARVRARPRPR